MPPSTPPKPKTPSFRRQPVPTPAPAAAAALPAPAAPGGGTLPFPTGEPVLTDYTRQQLAKLGWQEGDPIPGDLGNQIRKIQQDVAAEAATADHGFAPGSRVQVGKTVNIDDLPPEAQAKLRQHLVQYKEAVAEQLVAEQAAAAREAQVNPNASPSVQEAQRVALQGAEVHGPTIEFATPPTSAQVAAKMPPKLQPREGAVPVSAEGIASFVTEPIPTPANIPEPAPEPAPDPDEDVIEAGGLLRLERCPRCWWKLDDEFEATATVQDKQAFVAAILGGGRFCKTVEVMGGCMSIVFRTLTSNEVAMLYQQLGMDSATGEITTDAGYFVRLQEYRLYMCVEAIFDGDGHKLIDVPPIHEIEYEEPEVGTGKATRLITMKEWFNTEAVVSESLNRVLAQHHREFQRLVEALEAQTAEPDFWKGIES